MSDSLSSVWGYSVHFGEISDVKIFQKATAPTVFIQIQANFSVNMLIMSGYRPLLVW